MEVAKETSKMIKSMDFFHCAEQRETLLEI